MTPETEALIARVRELDAKATKGPWSHYQITQDRGHFRYLQAESNAVGVINTWPNHEPLADADLIAHYRTAAPQLADALEAAEKRADALQDDKDVLTGQLQEARRRADAEHERAEVLQSQVDNADTNLAQIRMIWKARADAAEAKLKVAREALDRIKRPVWWMQEDQRKATGSINGLDGHAAARLASDPGFLRGIAETALTQLEP